METTVAGDPVDWAADRFVAEGLGDSLEFAAMSSVLRLHRHLTSHMTEALKPLKLNPSTYMLLMTLKLADGNTLSLADLTRALIVHASTVTLMVDQLEVRGLVKRGPHATDRRTTLAKLTKKGQTLANEATALLRPVSFGLGASTTRDVRALVTGSRGVRQAAGDRDEFAALKPRPA